MTRGVSRNVQPRGSVSWHRCTFRPDPVSRRRPAASPITVRQLVTHTSGLGGQFTSAILNKFKPREGETYPTGPLPEQPRNPPNAPTRFNGGSGLS